MELSELSVQVVELLKAHGKTVALAESCTGGMVASLLTSVPGCSAVFGTGIVCYSLECKQTVLGVRASTLHSFGAVSSQTAEEMALGVQRISHADYCLSITGEAGPIPAEQHPVGTAFVGLACADGVTVTKLALDSRKERNALREEFAEALLQVLTNRLRRDFG